MTQYFSIAHLILHFLIKIYWWLASQNPENVIQGHLQSDPSVPVQLLPSLLCYGPCDLATLSYYWPLATVSHSEPLNMLFSCIWTPPLSQEMWIKKITAHEEITWYGIKLLRFFSVTGGCDGKWNWKKQHHIKISQIILKNNSCGSMLMNAQQKYHNFKIFIIYNMTSTASFIKLI